MIIRTAAAPGRSASCRASPPAKVSGLLYVSPNARSVGATGVLASPSAVRGCDDIGVGDKRLGVTRAAAMSNRVVKQGITLDL